MKKALKYMKIQEFAQFIGLYRRGLEKYDFKGFNRNIGLP